MTTAGESNDPSWLGVAEGSNQRDHFVETNPWNLHRMAKLAITAAFLNIITPACITIAIKVFISID